MSELENPEVWHRFSSLIIFGSWSGKTFPRLLTRLNLLFAPLRQCGRDVTLVLLAELCWSSPRSPEDPSCDAEQQSFPTSTEMLP